MAAALGLGQGGTQLLDAVIHVSRQNGFLGFGVLVGNVRNGCAGRAAAVVFAIGDALKIDAHLVVFRRPGVGGGVAALAAPVLTA